MSKKIAEERIRKLFELAERRTKEDIEDSQELADRYVEIARNIGMKHNVSIPKELRRKFCHNCHAYLKPGLNCQVRVNSKKSNITYRCNRCENINRYGYRE